MQGEGRRKAAFCLSGRETRSQDQPSTPFDGRAGAQAIGDGADDMFERQASRIDDIIDGEMPLGRPWPPPDGQ
jgi:hypothetical protein